MDTDITLAVIQAMGIVAFGFFALLMTNLTLERKATKIKSLQYFILFIFLAFIVSLPLRYYAILNPPDYAVNGIINTVNLSAALVEMSAILLITVLAHIFALRMCAGKASSKIFVSSFTALICVIVCSFVSDYIVHIFSTIVGLNLHSIEHAVFNLIIQTLLVAISLVLYYVLIRRSVQNLIRDMHGNMNRFIVTPIICYIFYVLNYCVWYIVPSILESDMRLQYLIISFVLPILYVFLFRLIFTEINSTAKSMRAEMEMSSAHLIQSSILPPSKTYAAEGVNISSMMVPARVIGGDFYDFFNLGDNKIAIFIADASGKGVPAALFMMRAHTLIRSNLMACQSPAEALTKSNQELLENNESLMFVTVFAGILDSSTGNLIYSCAGHNPPLIKNIVSGYLHIKKAPVLGITQIEYENHELTLDEGSILLLYTDGITEAMSEIEEVYGEKRLADLVDRAGILSVNDLVQIIYSDVQEFSSEDSDDITLMAIEYTGTCTKVFVPAEISQLSVIQSTIDDLNLKNEKLKSALRVVIEEVFTNIVQYAYPDSQGSVSVTFKTGEYVTLCFEDRGIQFNPLGNKDPNLEESLEERMDGGYGIYMTKNLVDHVSYTYKNGKNILTLAKKIE